MDGNTKAASTLHIFTTQRGMAFSSFQANVTVKFDKVTGSPVDNNGWRVPLSKKFTSDPSGGIIILGSILGATNTS